MGIVVFLLGMSITVASDASVQALRETSKEKIGRSKKNGEKISPLSQVVGRRGQFCRSSLSLGTPKSAPKQDNLLIFVSFSLPPESLKSFHEASHKIGGRLIVRGLIDHSFQKTLQKSKEIGIVVDVDPTLFSDYAVKSVPSVILRKEKRFDQVCGNIPLSDSLQIMASSGDLKEEAKKILNQMGEGT